MSARRLDGTAWAARLRDEVQPRVEAFTARRGRPPALAVVLAGEHPASEIYVRNKIATVRQHGCAGELHRLPATASLDDALALVTALNADDTVDGILVQSPLPEGMGRDAEQRVFDAVDPMKDVDGFHPINVGLLVQKRPALVACTPLGCAELLDREAIPLRGRHAVVIGRSDIVGKPMALLLLHRDATVTICHSRTADLAGVCRTADVLVAAVGRPLFVTPDFVKPGATVIDVGINRVDDRATMEAAFTADHPRRRVFEQKGSLLVGDVHPAVEAVAGAITPVPGGVGPLTIAMVLRNTLTAAERRAG
ncbi:MAG: bifunctional 5,10-methylenetetrahydrofolate dehydrogenase/5,10-methenyltetrahydrofolate cyclohydrolase [Vicinamibacterales bacterium]